MAGLITLPFRDIDLGIFDGPARDSHVSRATIRAQPFFDRFAALEVEGRYDDAFEALAAGNRIKDGELDGAAAVARLTTSLGALKATFTPAFLADWNRDSQERAPIFVIGMPRSGSTLVEQILAKHPLVQGMGETGDLARIASASFPFSGGTRFHPASMAQDYLQAVAERGWAGAGRFVDKSLTNYAHVGLIHLLFPRATILHTTRDPVASGFSCYSLLFGNDELMSFSYDLRAIGRRYVAYRQMMAHWSLALMGRVIEVRHEDLVADPEGGIRSLLERCGLPWHEPCLRFHETDRQVATASAEQVRRPIFTDRLGRWRSYARYLGPLIETLGPYAAPARATLDLP